MDTLEIIRGQASHTVTRPSGRRERRIVLFTRGVEVVAVVGVVVDGGRVRGPLNLTLVAIINPVSTYDICGIYTRV